MATPVETISRPWYDYGIGRAHDPADNAGGGELGVDLSTPLNTPITSPAGGIVTYAGSNPSTGGIVKVVSTVPGVGNILEYFLHLNTINVSPGQTISAGQQIGLSGGLQPGAGGWAHVEYGVSQDLSTAQQYWGFKTGSTIDPTPLLNTLHTTGGILPGVDPSILPGAQGIANLISGNAANLPGAQGAANTIQGGGGLLQVIVQGPVQSAASAFGTSAQDLAWRTVLIITGVALLLIGFFVLIWPSAKSGAQTAGRIAPVAVAAAA